MKPRNPRRKAQRIPRDRASRTTCHPLGRNGWKTKLEAACRRIGRALESPPAILLLLRSLNASMLQGQLSLGHKNVCSHGIESCIGAVEHVVGWWKAS